MSSGRGIQYSSISQSISGCFPVTGQKTDAVVYPARCAAVKMSVTRITSENQSQLSSLLSSEKE